MVFIIYEGYSQCQENNLHYIVDKICKVDTFSSNINIINLDNTILKENILPNLSKREIKILRKNTICFKLVIDIKNSKINNIILPKYFVTTKGIVPRRLPLKFCSIINNCKIVVKPKIGYAIPCQFIIRNLFFTLQY